MTSTDTTHQHNGELVYDGAVRTETNEHGDRWCAECGERILVMSDQAAYISLADEFDPMGASVGPDGTPMVPQLEEFDAEAVAAARRYAEANDIPLPWVLCSLDIALDYVKEVERGPRW